MMMQLLAEAANDPDFMISGKWLIGGLVTLIPVIGGVWIKAKQAGRAEAQESNVTIKKPVPTIQTREEPQWATRPDLDDHIGWTRSEFARVWGQFGTERAIDNEELTKIHDRIDKQSQATASVQGSLEEIGKNVTELLRLCLHGKIPPRSR